MMAAVMGAIALVFANRIGLTGFGHNALLVVIAGGAGLLTFVAAGRLQQMEEVNMFTRSLLRRK